MFEDSHFRLLSGLLTFASKLRCNSWKVLQIYLLDFNLVDPKTPKVVYCIYSDSQSVICFLRLEYAY